MARRVFVHIGLPKTATTYLQDCLWEHKEALSERGLLVPGRHRRRHLLATLDIREDPKLARRSGDVAHPWQDLVDEVAAWPGDALISHEFFAAAHTAGIERVRDSFGDAEVHVVITARATVDLGISRWQEWVKNGGRRNVDAYPPEAINAATDEWGWESFDLADVLDRWGAVFAHDRIHVLPMRPGVGEPAELWHRFAGVAGIDVTDLEVAYRPANTSLGLVEAELLRRVNAELTFTTAAQRANWIRSYLGEGTVLRRTGEKVRPGPQKLADLTARGQRAIDQLSRGGYDVVGDLRFLEPADVASYRHPDEVGADEMLDAAAFTIARLVEDVKSLTEERDRLARPVPTLSFRQRLRVSLGRFSRARPERSG